MTPADGSAAAASRTVPAAAAWLGGLGALPFVGLALGLVFVEGAWQVVGAQALAAYGAAILSFLGGIHWGLAIGARQAGDGMLARRLVVSVVPSLVGWLALLVPERAGLWILALAVAAMLPVDLRATRAGHAPAWYPRLRIPLTAVVVASLLLAASF